MHVTIVLLTENDNDVDHWQDDEVFSRNPGKFDDGVEEFYGDEREEAVDEMCSNLGVALVGRGWAPTDARKTAWIEIDPDKTDSLFMQPFGEFIDALHGLRAVSLQGFMDGDSAVETAMQRLREAYGFDWLYVLSEYGDAKPVSEWLRELRREAKDKPGPRRFYVHAAYDGDQ